MVFMHVAVWSSGHKNEQKLIDFTVILLRDTQPSAHNTQKQVRLDKILPHPLADRWPAVSVGILSHSLSDYLHPKMIKHAILYYR